MTSTFTTTAQPAPGAATPNYTVIDGSYLEGGGQILRNAFAYSALSGKPVRVENVRGNRKPPGLKAQHVAGLDLVSRLSEGSKLTGAEQKSTTVVLDPGRIVAGSYEADPKTAGSTTLLLQDGPIVSQLTLRGGTNAIQAPPVDFTQNVFFPFLAKHFNVHPSIKLRRRGFFPRGQGEISVSIPAASGALPALDLRHRGSVTRIRGRAYVAGTLPKHIPRSIVATAEKELVAAGYPKNVIDIEQVVEQDAIDNASGIFLWAETDGGCVISGGAIGEKSKRADALGKEAASELIANLGHGGCVDEYLQDQIIIFMALAGGRSTITCGPLSLHTRTAIWIAETMTQARFTIIDGDNGLVTLECDGIGHVAGSVEGATPTSGDATASL